MDNQSPLNSKLFKKLLLIALRNEDCHTSMSQLQTRLVSLWRSLTGRDRLDFHGTLVKDKGNLQCHGYIDGRGRIDVQV